MMPYLHTCTRGMVFLYIFSKYALVVARGSQVYRSHLRTLHCRLCPKSKNMRLERAQGEGSPCALPSTG